MSRKRGFVETAPAPDETGSTLFLSCQNQALSLEMYNYRRQVAETRKELEAARHRSREMETLVSVIQRAWSQLEIDSNMLLDALGESAEGSNAQEQGKINAIFNEFLSSGSKLRSSDPTDITQLPPLDVDRWSSPEEIIEECDRVKKSLLQQDEEEESTGKDENTGKKGSDDNKEDEENRPSILTPTTWPHVGDHLLTHSTFALSVIERLCAAISEAELLSQAPEVVSAIADAKECYAERFTLMDKITKLSHEVYELEQKIFDSEKKRMMTEEALNPTATGNLGIGEAKADSAEADVNAPPSSSSSSSSDVIKADVAAPATYDADMIAKHAATEKELRRIIAILDKQIAESEAAKAKVEMTLSQKMNRPLMAQSETEEQTAFMKKAIDTLRLQSKQRCQVLITESNKLSQRVATLELAVSRCEGSCASKVAEAKAMTETAIKQAKAEKEATRTSVNAAQAEAARIIKLKSKATELQNLEKTARGDCNKLNAQVRQVSATQERLRDELSQSRAFERELETKIRQSLKPADRGPPCAANPVDVFKRLESLQVHCAQSLQESLVDTLASISDLTLEIEGVATEEAKVREQTARTLQQIAENLSMQRGVLEENVKLSEQAAELLALCTEIDKKIELTQALVSQQEKILQRLKTEESTAKGELSALKRVEAEEKTKTSSDGSRIKGSVSKLNVAEKSLQQILKKNAQLQSQCDHLARQWDKERRLRFNAQREARPQAPPAPTKREEASGAKGTSASLTDEEASLLESSLGILRCSVCKDRFKSVAITRCYHLFCKECIDENLRNRHRKCPACGEKFGSDDVRSVSFTL